MATFFASTTSNGSRITDIDAVRRILDAYYIDPGEGTEISPLTQDPKTHTWAIGFWSDGWFAAYPRADEDREIDYDDECSHRLLKAVQPYLQEPLVIHSIGAEKLRYPFAALEIVVPPTHGRIRYFGFKGEQRLNTRRRPQAA